MASWRFGPSERAAGCAPLHRYRVVVVASAVGTLVESAGGYLCDMAREGWDVGVLLREPCDARPLSILGVARHEVLPDLAAAIEGLAPGPTLMVGADLLTGDGGTRRAVSRLARDCRSLVTVYGRPGQGLERTPHTLSAAARAFKTSALRTTQRDAVVDPIESLFRFRGNPGQRVSRLRVV
jgi:hypothetical protein